MVAAKTWIQCAGEVPRVSPKKVRQCPREVSSLEKKMISECRRIVECGKQRRESVSSLTAKGETQSFVTEQAKVGGDIQKTASLCLRNIYGGSQNIASVCRRTAEGVTQNQRMYPPKVSRMVARNCFGVQVKCREFQGIKEPVSLTSVQGGSQISHQCPGEEPKVELNKPPRCLHNCPGWQPRM
jgi:hypothetical protein